MLATFSGNSVFQFTQKRMGGLQASERQFHFYTEIKTYEMECSAIWPFTARFWPEGIKDFHKTNKNVPCIHLTHIISFFQVEKGRKTKNYWISLTLCNEKLSLKTECKILMWGQENFVTLWLSGCKLDTDFRHVDCFTQWEICGLILGEKDFNQRG